MKKRRKLTEAKKEESKEGRKQRRKINREAKLMRV